MMTAWCYKLNHKWLLPCLLSLFVFDHRISVDLAGDKSKIFVVFDQIAKIVIQCSHKTVLNLSLNLNYHISGVSGLNLQKYTAQVFTRATHSIDCLIN